LSIKKVFTIAKKHVNIEVERWNSPAQAPLFRRKGKRMDIEIMAEGEGLAEVEEIRIPEGSPARVIVAAIAAKGGYATEDALLFVEDCDEPLDLAIILSHDERERKVHHVHRALKIEVAVYYQSRHVTRHFPPSARVQRVLDWAVGRDGFNIDPVIAPEMELAFQSTGTALPKNAHIGRYVRHPHHKLALDLIRGIVPNGASL
jgi:hypothetical protein